MTPATIKDVAREAGVSISVVSYVLNDTPGRSISEPTRSRVKEAAQALDYIPNSMARAMRSRASRTLGLISFWTDHAQNVFVEVLGGVVRTANDNGYNAMVFQPRNFGDEYAYIDAFRRRYMDGLVALLSFDAVGNKLFTERHLPMIRKLRIPTVILNNCGKFDDIPCLPFDYYGSAYLAVQTAAQRGHTRIGYLFDGNETSEVYIMSERWRGYCDGLADAGLSVVHDWVYDSRDPMELIVHIRHGAAPTALVAQKSLVAHEVMRAFAHNGLRIPEDISLVACNFEIFSSYLIPRLTLTMHPLRALGEAASCMLINQLNAGVPNYTPLEVSPQALHIQLLEGESLKRIAG